MVLGEHKLLHIKNSNGKANKCSIVVPASSQNMKDFRSIKIVNSGCSQLKSANIKAVAANLLQKSKQGLLQKNIFTKEEFEMEDTDDDDDDDLNFDKIMQDTDAVLGAHDDDDDFSSAESSGSGYPKLVLTNEEKRLLSKVIRYFLFEINFLTKLCNNFLGRHSAAAKLPTHQTRRTRIETNPPEDSQQDLGTGLA